jgi:hypothetical protein
MVAALAQGAQALGAIPALEGQSKDKPLVMFADGQSGPAESFRVLRTNLQFTAVARPSGVPAV